MLKILVIVLVIMALGGIAFADDHVRPDGMGGWYK